jgi:hypothetical protein
MRAAGHSYQRNIAGLSGGVCSTGGGAWAICRAPTRRFEGSTGAPALLALQSETGDGDQKRSAKLKRKLLQATSQGQHFE